MNSEMISALQRRFKKHFPGTIWKEVDGYFKFSEKETLFCEYCKTELKGRDYPTHAFVPSIDHVIPTSRKGLNTFENIIICCHQCNIVKGTLFGSTFKTLLKILDVNPEFKKNLLKEWYSGQFANKMERTHGKKKKEEPQAPKELWKYV